MPEVALENSADLPVLLVAGEELVGAKQNRMVNLTILAPAKSKIVIPVSCVEAGRWRSVSSRFAPADHLVFSRLRAQSAAYVTENLRREGRRHTRQHLVWDSIAERCRLFEAESGTGAVDAIFERRRDDLGEFVRAMQWQEGQAGAAFLIDDRPAGIDVFDHPGTMREMLQKLVRSYAVDALGEEALRKSHPANRRQRRLWTRLQESASGFRRWTTPERPWPRQSEWDRTSGWTAGQSQQPRCGHWTGSCTSAHSRARRTNPSLTGPGGALRAGGRGWTSSGAAEAARAWAAGRAASNPHRAAEEEGPGPKRRTPAPRRLDGAFNSGPARS